MFSMIPPVSDQSRAASFDTTNVQLWFTDIQIFKDRLVQLLRSQVLRLHSQVVKVVNFHVRLQRLRSTDLTERSLTILQKKLS